MDKRVVELVNELKEEEKCGQEFGLHFLVFH
jgi:hypothetical protein